MHFLFQHFQHNTPDIQDNSPKTKTSPLFLRLKDSFLLRVLLIGFIVFLISTFFYQAYFVAGDSMNPIYHNHDMLLIKKYNASNNLNYNDVIVIQSKKVKQMIVKRVIGLPGDTIQIIDGQVYINHSLYKEFSNFDTISDAGNVNDPMTLGDDEYFVLGDNRNASIDSRFDQIGPIPASSIKGKVIFHF